MTYGAKLKASPKYALAIGAADGANRRFDSGANCGSLACSLRMSCAGTDPITAQFRSQPGT